MKKLQILLFALLPIIAFSQETTNMKAVKFGVQGGATYYGLKGSNMPEYTHGFNYLIGVLFEVPLSNKFSLVTNLNLERKSERSIVRSQFFYPPYNEMIYLTTESRNTFQYLTLPLNIKYYLGQKKRFYINGGPYASYIVGRFRKVNGDKQNAFSLSIRHLDYGINLGAGYRLPIYGSNNINIELRDNMGLVDVNDNSRLGPDKVHTNTVNLIVSWQFKL
jgi:hypothetical protein